jgi:hypothetical protein
MALKTELGQRWPMIGLLDIFKETELRVNFTQVFHSPTVYENIDRATLRERLLLCLHGIGTNTGLKRMDRGPARYDLQGPSLCSPQVYQQGVFA